MAAVTGERFRQAAMSDNEIADLTQRFAAVARILGVDELKIEHRDGEPVAPGLTFASMLSSCYLTMPVSVMIARIGDRKLTCEIPVEVLADAREASSAR